MRPNLLILGLSLTFGLVACSSPAAPTGSGTSSGVLGQDWQGLPHLAPLAVQGSAFVSDLTPSSATNGWGPWEKDRSNGERAAGDGRALMIGGQTYAKGIGVHADSSLVYDLSGSTCNTFSASVGVDDEVGGQGSVVFEVLVDGVSKFKSAALRGTDGAQQLSVPLAGAKQLTLKVSNADDTYSYDHADWANAKLNCGEAGGTLLGNATTRIQAEDYDPGGEGVGYHDNDAVNQGGLYRPSEGVDVERRGAVDGYNVGWSGPGEWLEYTLNVAQAGQYRLDMRTLTFKAGQQLSISIDGQPLLTPTLPVSGDFNTNLTAAAGTLNLTAGKHVMRVAYVGPAPATNLDWFELTLQGNDNAHTVSATFTSTTANFPNPERGFHGNAPDLAAEPTGSLDGVAATGDRLVRSYIRLDAYRASALDAAWLARLNQGFERARKSGLKIILRFSYNFPGDDDSPNGDYTQARDASLSQVLQHIEQIKPILAQNADVLAYLQAGFIGAWGEWHDSSNTLTSDANKTTIRDALLAAVPPGVSFQVRYPADVRNWSPQPPSEADAFTDRARIGIHNDCFLAGEGDTGTFDGLNDPLREYTKALAKVTPFGAETCNVGNLRWDCPDILREGKDYSLTYLNRDFYAAFVDRWRAQGCYEEVARSIGYRFRLVKASHPASAAKGGGWALALTVQNDGWSRLFSQRQVKVVLRNKSTGQLIERLISGVDPRRWLSGTGTSVSLPLTLPADAAAGQYDVLVGLPDAAPSLAGDARYAIRFANADDSAKNQVWEGDKGLFKLGTTLTIN
ncbi:NPCBM/NEW2 domain-containing protein [Deinococcus sp.]|uniref:NPCBM/NEW2 domain-containing protein n=1 Tax=Deinococcus sp. TaxID=47478 RepID=UPI003B5C0FF6